jgi:hypothetical protein
MNSVTVLHEHVQFMKKRETVHLLTFHVISGTCSCNNVKLFMREKIFGTVDGPDLLLYDTSGYSARLQPKVFDK